MLANAHEILKHIPHRYPFVLIDKVESCVPGQSVRVIKNVTRNEWFFSGTTHHELFMPQMLILEALAQAAGVLCHYSGAMKGTSKPLIFFAGIDRTVFHRNVPAGSQLTLACRLVRILKGVAKIESMATVADEIVVTSHLTAVIRETPN